MLSIWLKVCRLHTLYHSVHLHYLCISIQPLLLLEDVLGGHDRARVEMHLETVIGQFWRCTWRPIDWGNPEMHLPARIEGVGRCTWWLRSSELRDALGS
jgi:hypothetical protein